MIRSNENCRRNRSIRSRNQIGSWPKWNSWNLCDVSSTISVTLSSILGSGFSYFNSIMKVTIIFSQTKLKTGKGPQSSNYYLFWDENVEIKFYVFLLFCLQKKFPWIQIVGTGLLAFCVLMIIDPRNKIPSAAHPLLFGISLLVIGCAFGWNCGYPLNPARDFAPRLFTYLIYGKNVFT